MKKLDIHDSDNDEVLANGVDRQPPLRLLPNDLDELNAYIERVLKQRKQCPPATGGV